MVATVLRLRYRILGNVLASSPWQLVGFVLGGLWALGVLAMLIPGLIFLGTSAPVETTRVVIIAAGSLLTLGWVLGPLIMGGIDTTVDPARLMPFPLTRPQVMLSVAAVGASGIGGIISFLAGWATMAAWVRWPVAIAVTFVAAPIGIAICVLASRLVAALASASGRGRRAREVLGILVLVVLMLSGPILAGVFSLVGGAGQDVLGRVAGVVDVLSWSPIGAAWAVAGDVAAGAPAAAGLKALIALATIAVLWLVWDRVLAQSSGAPAQAAARRSKGDSLGWFGRLPQGPLGATWARSLTYWTGDSRYLRNLIVIPILPILFGFSSGFVDGSPLFLFSSVIAGAILGMVPYTDVSYDSTAFTGVLATGIRGRADRAGRTLAAATIGIPLIAAITIAVVAVSGRWSLLPALLGASVGTALVGFGISAISSAYLVVPVPEPGDNMFKRVPGATFAMTLAFFAIFLVTAVLAAPGVIAAGVVAATGASWAGSWIALAIGLVVGLGVVIGGVLIGGRIFDSSGPLLLQRLRALKGI